MMERLGRIAAISGCAALATGSALWFGLLGGQAHERADVLAGRFARADAEQSVRTACRSSAPFVVLDTFRFLKPANIDDADDERSVEIGHGDLVAAIAAASHPGAIPYQLDPVFNVASLTSDIARLARDIETGKIARPAAVVSSIVLPVELAEVNARTRGKPFEPKDVVSRRAELAGIVTDGRDPRNAYARIGAQLARITGSGVPVFVAAGNSGPDSRINALALFDGVYAVGALGKDGAPAPYTSLPDFVSIWSSGYFVLRETPSGLRVGDRGEIRGASLPEQKSVLAAYVGRHAEDVVRKIPALVQTLPADVPPRVRNRYLALHLEPGLYRTTELMSVYGRAKGAGGFESAVAEGPYMHFPFDTIFQTDESGALRFDPLGDASDGQLQVQDATSFAAPNICATVASRP